MAFLTNNICTSVAQLDIQSGTGSLNIGSSTGAKVITIGNSTTTSSVTINAGTNGISIGSTDATAHNVSIGNTTGTSSLTLNAGTGAMNIGIGIAKTITIGNNTGTTAVNINAGTAGTNHVITNGIYTLATGTGTVTISGDATANSVDIGTGAGAKTITVGSTNTTSSVTINTGSGGITIPSFTTTGAVVVNAAGVISDANASTAGFVLTSTGAGTAPTFQAVPATGMPAVDQTSSPVTMVVDTHYSMNLGTLITATLPATAAFGSVIKISGQGVGLWTIAQNAGQTIHTTGGNTTTGVGGSLSSSGTFDSVELFCSVVDTDFVAVSMTGSLTIV